jgi:hypothetical protein
VPPADGGHPGGRRTGGCYTTDGHRFLRYGEKEDTEGTPTWRQERFINNKEGHQRSKGPEGTETPRGPEGTAGGSGETPRGPEGTTGGSEQAARPQGPSSLGSEVGLSCVGPNRADMPHWPIAQRRLIV